MKKAIKYMRIIAASHGLSIIEPVYDEESTAQVPAAPNSVTTTLPYYPDLEEDNENESLRWWIWTSLLAALCGILILFLVIGFISTYIQTDRSNRPVPAATEEAPSVL